MVEHALRVLKEDFYDEEELEWPMTTEGVEVLVDRLLAHVESARSRPDIVRPVGEIWRHDVRIRLVSVITDEPLQTADLIPPGIMMLPGPRRGSVSVRLEMRNTLGEGSLENLLDEESDDEQWF